MSKNMTRKGLAFGAMVALSATSFVALPAVADATGPVTLLPNGGVGTNATFTSIAGVGIDLSSRFDGTLPSISGSTSGDNLTFASDSSYWLISNAGGATFTVDLNDSLVTNYIIFDLDGKAMEVNSATANLADTDVATNTDPSFNGFNFATVAVATADSGSFNLNSAGTGAQVTSVPFVKVADGASAVEITTNAGLIAIKASIPVVASGDADQEQPLDIKVNASSSITKAVSLGVRVFTDTVTSSATTEKGRFNSAGFELASDIETVTLLPLSAVSATTTIEKLETKATASAANSEVTFKTVFSNSINPYAVDAATYFSLFKDGATSAVNLNGDNNPADGTNATKISVGDLNSRTISKSAWYVNAAGTALAVIPTGVYSAQAYISLDGGTTFTAVGAASPVVDTRAGVVTEVDPTDAVDATSVSNINVSFNSTSDVVLVREGTKAVTVTVVVDSPAIEKANIEFRAIATAVSLDAKSSVTVSGALAALAKDDDVTTGYARSLSNGKATFTFTNAGALDGDEISISFQAKDEAGVWSNTADTVTVEWQEAALAQLKAIPGTYISGANPSITFSAVDQFDQPISKTDNGDLSVTAVAMVGGLEDKTKFNKTEKLVNGQVTFTFANYATAASPAQLKATLLEGTTTATVTTGTNPVTVNVYNTSTTASISVVDAYSMTITYKDYVIGKATDVAVADKVTLTGIGSPAANEFQDITGTVLNANNVGQPGVNVKFDASGILFYDSATKTYAQDSITVYADEFGNFTVRAFAKIVNTAGHKVTITADGKTASTLLRTYLPASLSGANLQFMVTTPAEIVMNTTYAVVGTLKDKWGNPVATSTNGGVQGVTFQGAGSVEINNVGTEVNRNFGRDGTVTVYVRSVKDIAGPGAITATVNAANYSYLDTSDVVQTNGTLSVGAQVTNSLATEWDETKWTPTVNVTTTVVKTGATTGKVNVGSFNGKLVVYASGLNGARISWKVGGNWGSAVATSNYSIFNRPTPRAGATVSVEVFVNGVKQLTKSVVTR